MNYFNIVVRKNTILFFLSIVITCNLSAQDNENQHNDTQINDYIPWKVNEQKKINSIELRGEIKYSKGFEQDSEQYDSILNILNEDVIKFYHLEDEYDTELKRKIFNNTEDYKQKLQTIQELKRDIKAANYYIDAPANWDYYGKDIKYDLETKSFTIPCDGININNQDIIFYDHIVFKCPKEFSLIFNPEKGMMFKIQDENLALKIEENRSNLRIKYILKIIGIDDDIEHEHFEEVGSCLVGVIQKVIIYSSETNEEFPIYIEPKTNKVDVKEKNIQKNTGTNSKNKQKEVTSYDLEGKVYILSKSNGKPLKILRFERNNQVQLYINDVWGDNVLPYSVKNGIIIIHTIKNLSIRYQIINNKQLKLLHSTFLGNSKLEGSIYNCQN